MSKMTAKEFDLLISLILPMPKSGKVDEVIKLLEPKPTPFTRLIQIKRLKSGS